MTSETYSSIGRDTEGLRKLFRQFSFPGGIPSHVAPETTTRVGADERVLAQALGRRVAEFARRLRGDAG